MTYTAIANTWIRNGGNPKWAPLMTGIALAESGGTIKATNTSDPYGGSFGLWQINGSHAPGGQATTQWIARMKTPTQNAKEAIAIFGTGAGANAWRTDRTWNQWKAAGFPKYPTSTTVVSWLKAAGVSTGSQTPGHEGTAGGTYPTSTIAKGTPNPTTPKNKTTCVIKVPLGITSVCILNSSQARALKGGLLMVAGGTVMALGIVMLGAYGLSSARSAALLRAIRTRTKAPVPAPSAEHRERMSTTPQYRGTFQEQTRQARERERHGYDRAHTPTERPFGPEDETPGLSAGTAQRARRRDREMRPRAHR